MTRRRKVLLSVLGALALAALGLAVAAWAFRDWPRRRVERTLSERLAADVALGKLEIEGKRRFVLRDLAVRRVAGQPRVGSVVVDRLEVEGSIRDILDGRIETLVADGVVLRLTAPDPSVPPSPPGAAPPRIEHLDVRHGRIVFGELDEGGMVEFESSLSGLFEKTEGHVIFGARLLRLDPVIVSGLRGEVDLAAGGNRADLRVACAGLGLAWNGIPVELPAPSVEAVLERDRGHGTASVHAVPRIGLWREADVNVTLREPDLDLVAGKLHVAGIDIAALLRLWPESSAWVQAEGAADLDAILESPSSCRYAFRAALGDLRIPERILEGTRQAGPPPGGFLQARSVTLDAAGAVDPARPASGGALRIEASVASAWGTIAGIAPPHEVFPVRVSAEGTVRVEPAPGGEGSLRIVTGSLGEWVARGEGETGTSPRSDIRWRWTGSDLAALTRVAAAYGVAVPEGLALTGRTRAEGTLRGDPRSPEIAATIAVAPLSAEKKDTAGRTLFSLRDAEATARVGLPSHEGVVHVHSVEARGTAAWPPLAPVPISLRGSGSVDPQRGTGEATWIALESPGLFRAGGSGRFAAHAEPKVAFDAAVDGVDLSRWRPFLKPWIGDPVPGFDVTGSVDARLRGTGAGSGRVSATGTAALRGCGLSSEDGARAIQGFDTTWDVRFETTESAEIRLDARAKASGFQALWGTFFADYSRLPSNVEIDAALGSVGTAASTRPWRASGRWNWEGGPRIELDARSGAEDGVDFAARLDIEDFGSTLERYLRGPLGETVPFFNRIGGTGSIRVEVAGRRDEGGAALAGRIDLHQLDLAGTRGVVEIKGLDLEAPFDLKWGPAGPDGARSVSGPALAGRLSFTRLGLSGLEIPETSTGLRVQADAIGLEDPLAVPFLGGALGFEQLTLRDLAGPSRRLETAILVAGVELSDLSRAFDFPLLEGRADGYFPRVQLTGPTLRVEGGGEVAFFGGKLKFGDISGEDMLTRFPKLAFSASFEGVDLEKVTRTFDVGSMTGLARGYVDDCQLFRWVPTRFAAGIETDPAHGRNRIDVKAINNIAILGGGGKIGIFDRGLHKLLDTYTYSRLGVAMLLADDVFLLRGLERRGDRELFIKGRLPFPIDVVNGKPERTVSFRTMLDRVKSVEFKVHVGR